MEYFRADGVRLQVRRIHWAWISGGSIDNYYQQWLLFGADWIIVIRKYVIKVAASYKRVSGGWAVQIFFCMVAISSMIPSKSLSIILYVIISQAVEAIWSHQISVTC